LILAISSDSTIRRSLSFTHLHTGQGVQEQSEIPTLVDCVETTISAYVVSSSKASHTLTRLPGFGASMFHSRRLPAFELSATNHPARGVSKVSYRDKGDSHPYLRA